jgi:glucose-6-phosphate 1-epimerase
MTTTLPDGAKLETGPGGLERLVLAVADAEAHVYLHGAHVVHFQPAGERPVLWVSASSQYQGGTPGKPIRGGVPLCFPWFGPRPGVPDAPLHGVARLLPWSLGQVTPVAPGSLSAELVLASNDYTRRFFPHEFVLRLCVSVGRALRLELQTRNVGPTAFRFEEALHSYFAVGDVRRVEIGGVEGASYVDKTDAASRKTHGARPLTISAETDRVFTGHRGPLMITDPSLERRILVERRGSATAVVWNPWQAKARAMPDFGDGEWPAMLCVEAANALDDAVSLAPGAEHSLETTVSVRPV